MKLNWGFELDVRENPMGFSYGPGVFGPEPEVRKLSDIRSSLKNPDCEGPEALYCIAMDVGQEQDKEEMKKRNLLFGIVTYAKGTIGNEPVRSQGHIHAISPSCGGTTGEVYEIWSGEAYIYMQESGADHPGRCFAIHAKAGQVVVVPPGWVHATINADVNKALTFGAWCVRDYGFDYETVREHGGIAFYPVTDGDEIQWEPNPSYQGGSIAVKEARAWPEFQIQPGVPVYRQFQQDYDRFLFVSQPELCKTLWENFEP